MKTLRTNFKLFIVFSLAGFSVLAYPVFSSWSGNISEGKPDRKEEGRNPNLVRAGIRDDSRPMVIWYEALAYERLDVLKLALKSGHFTHVILKGMSVDDRPNYGDKPIFLKMIQACRDAGVKIIWMRWLWPGYNLQGFDQSTTPYSPEFYSSRLVSIQNEVEKYELDYSALDCEPYGNSPMIQMRRHGVSGEQSERMVSAVSQALQKHGCVDFVMPSGYNDFYRCLVDIGHLKICEFTYYEHTGRIKRANRHIDYDIFGAFCSMDPERPGHAPYFTPARIMNQPHLWENTKGLMIYSAGRDASLKVAEGFMELPVERKTEYSPN